MKLDELRKKQGLISVSLVGVSALLGVLILIKVGGFFAASASAERLVSYAVGQSKSDPNDTKRYLAKLKEVADELKKNNMFAPPPPKPGMPVRQVTGILGKMALINGKWCKVGDKIGDAKVLEITPTYVKVEWKGKEKIYSPFNVKGVVGTKSDSGRREDAAGRVRRERPEGRPKARRGGRRGFGNMSREERKQLREKMRDMSPEERREYMRKMREESNGG